MAVEFRYANLNEYPGINKFIGQYWAEDHVYTRSRALFEWTFRRPGQWDSESYSLTVAVDGGELVGILGGIPFTLNRMGQHSKAVWIVNYVVRPDYRKGATALKLLSSFRRPEFAAVVAFGINPISVPIYQVLRGKVLPEIPRHFLIMPGQEERMARVLRISQPDWPDERIADLVSKFHTRKLPEATSIAGDSLPEHWDENEWGDLSAHTVGAARDAEYLNWRYRQHPIFTYRFVTIRAGSRTGLAVWRLETIQRATELGRDDVDTIARLLEFLPVSLDNAGQLLRAVLKDIETAGAMAVDFYSYHSVTRRWLKELGFPGSDSHSDGEFLPSRFQPLDGKKGGIMSAIFLQDSDSSNFSDDNCPWYWTKSDSDQDRPN